jgi:hypothetical protein
LVAQAEVFAGSESAFTGKIPITIAINNGGIRELGKQLWMANGVYGAGRMIDTDAIDVRAQPARLLLAGAVNGTPFVSTFVP